MLAVLSALLVPLAQSSQPDNDDYYAYIAAALYSIAVSTSPSGTPSVSAQAPHRSLPRPRSLDVLWLTSLVLAVPVALLCILAKQWLVDYTNRTTMSAKSPRLWARRRDIYSSAVIRRGTRSIITEVLPLLLHLALLLFAIGLVILSHIPQVADQA